MDGYITIGTKLETGEVDKDLQKLYDKLEKEQEKMQNLLTRKEQLDLDISKYQNKIESAGKKTDELANKLEDLAKTQLSLDGLEINEKNIQMAKEYLSSLDLNKIPENKLLYFQAKQYKEIEEEFNKFVNKIDDANKKTAILEQKYAMVDNQIQKCEATQMKLVQDIDKTSNSTEGININLSKMEKNANRVADKFGTMLKRVGKIALALVGVRTIINLLTRSFNILTQYNEELGSKVEQMRLVLAVGLEPIINWLISMLHTILSLVNQISIALSGIDLFGRASELWTKKMAQNLSGSASSVKDMKKQLAGFDEMNVLTDTSATSGGGGGGGSSNQEWTLTPEFDWSKFDIHTLMDKALKLVDDVIQGINDYLKNTSPEEIADGISTLIIGLLDIATKTFVDLDWQQLGKTFVEVLANLDWGGILVALIENIVGSLTWPLDLLMGLIDGLVEIFESPDCLTKLMDAGVQMIVALAKGLWTILEKSIELGVKLTVGIVKIIMSLGQRIYELEVEIVTKIIEWVKNGGIEKVKQWIKDFLENTKTKFTEFINNVKQKMQPLIDWFKEKIEFVKTVFKLEIEIIKNVFANIVQWVKDRIQDIYNFFNSIITGIKTIVGNVVQWIKDKFNTFVNFFRDIGMAIGDFFSSAIKGAVNGALSWVESKVNWFIDKINSVISLINKIPGVSIGKLTRISLPRLAVGGIINNPGKGVPIGNAIAGERGREGILPLTDYRAMQELGKEIGKWITINANIPVNIGNRQVARVLEEINADREFAMNS